MTTPATETLSECPACHLAIGAGQQDIIMMPRATFHQLCWQTDPKACVEAAEQIPCCLAKVYLQTMGGALIIVGGSLGVVVPAAIQVKALRERLARMNDNDVVFYAEDRVTIPRAETWLWNGSGMLRFDSQTWQQLEAPPPPEAPSAPPVMEIEEPPPASPPA